MSKIYNHFNESIGNTPLFRMQNFERKNNLSAHVLAKPECFNPAGSVKDGIAWAMVDDAERSGKLKVDSVIIEPTNANTGVGLAAMAAARGYRIIIAMPETMSIERRKILPAYDAELVLTAESLGMKGAIAKAKELAAQTSNSFIPSQFTNPANPECHKRTTARKNLPVLSEGVAAPRKIQGIGAGFTPDTLNTKIYDEVLRMTNDDAFDTAKEIAYSEDLLVEISSGAAAYVSKKLAEKNPRKIIVALLPDTGERYLSAFNFES